MSYNTTAPSNQLKRGLKVNVAFIISIGIPTMLGCIDVMALGLALPSIMKEFSSNIISAQWIFTAYMLGNISFLILIGDLIGKLTPKKLLVTGLIIFITASILCGSPYDIFIILIIGRFFQGIGVAIILTTSISLINLLYFGYQRQVMTSLWSFFVGVGIALGPMIGAIILMLSSWRILFFINIPLIMCILPIIKKYIPDGTDTLRQRIFVKKHMFYILILSALTLLFSGTLHTTSSILLSILLLLLIILTKGGRELTCILRSASRKFIVACYAGFISYSMLYSFLFITTIHLQKTFNLPLLKIAIYYLAYSVPFSISSLILGRINCFKSNINFLIFGLSLSSISFLMFSFSSFFGSLLLLIPVFFILGVSIAVLNISSLKEAFDNNSSQEIGATSSIVYTFRWMGGIIGITITAVIYHYLSVAAGNHHLLYNPLLLICLIYTIIGGGSIFSILKVCRNDAVT